LIERGYELLAHPIWQLCQELDQICQVLGGEQMRGCLAGFGAA